MQIAVVGGGLCGLAVCWSCLELSQGKAAITLIDSSGIGGGASGISAGLLHAFAGLKPRRLRLAEEGIAATKHLLAIATQMAGQPLYTAGMLRPALNAQQAEDLHRCCTLSAEVEWWDAARCQAQIPGMAALPGLWEPQGLTIRVPQYLESLWQACQKYGTAKHQQRRIASLAELDSYDAVVIAMGPATTALPELAHLPIKPLKGQLVEIAWPKNCAPLPFSLVGEKYIVMSADQTWCTVGSTFERNFTTTAPTPDHAVPEMLEKAFAIFPPLRESRILHYRAGLRTTGPSLDLPYLHRFANKRWVFAGIGSKGLLYHAWVGQAIAADILGTTPIEQHALLGKRVFYH